MSRTGMLAVPWASSVPRTTSDTDGPNVRTLPAQMAKVLPPSMVIVVVNVWLPHQVTSGGELSMVGSSTAPSDVEPWSVSVDESLLLATSPASAAPASLFAHGQK